MDNDSLGNRMKDYEMVEAGRVLDQNLPVMIRLDGRSFSNFTKGLKRPFDQRLTDLMISTTKFLVEETNAVLAYQQSDEISLILFKQSPESQLFFDARIQKLTSVIASMATAYFNSDLHKFLPEKIGKLAYFDCRAWNVPTTTEAVNTILWRELDATKNAISMAAQHYYSHNALQNKNGQEKKMMLLEKGIDFEKYPSFFKRGSYIRRVKKAIRFSFDEICNLPQNHEARINPDLIVERNIVERVELPPITKVINREEVFFKGEDPVCLLTNQI